MVDIVTIADGDTDWGGTMRANLQTLATGINQTNTLIAAKYSLPSGGIPASDLASAVRGQLSLASSAYQKPTSGIPATDLASAVQGAINRANSAVLTVNGYAPDASGNVAVGSGGGGGAVNSVNGMTGDVVLGKTDVGLGNVDNTADANKPVSTAQNAAIGAKYTKPSQGIPASDLFSDVQTSLAKADSAVQPSALAAYVKTVNGIAPDANGNVAVSGGSSGVSSVNSRTGDVTLAKSDVGLTNVDNTSDANKPVSTATQTALNGKLSTNVTNSGQAFIKSVGGALTGLSFTEAATPGTLALRAADGTLAVAAPTAAGQAATKSYVDSVLGAENVPAEEVPLYVYGDSIALGSNATTPSTRGWAPLLASPNRLASSSYTNYAVSSTVMGDITRNVLTGTISNSTRRGLHIIHSGINSIINVTAANDTAEKTGFVTALKANLRILRGSWLLATDASITYTGTWTNKSLPGVTHSTPNVKQSDTSGNYFTISTTADEIAIMLIGFSTASPSDGGPYTITVNGASYTPDVSTTAATTSPNNPWGPQSVRVVNPSPGSTMSVRLTRGAGASFYMDGYVVKDPNPPAIMVCNIIMPTQTGLNVNGASSNRTPANVTNFNNLIASVVNSAEFSADGQVSLVDISPGFDNATMRTAEAIHPNNIGHKVIAYNLENAARALPTSTGLSL